MFSAKHGIVGAVGRTARRHSPARRHHQGRLGCHLMGERLEERMLLTGWIVTTPSIIQCWDVTTAPDDPTETIVAGHTKATNRDFAVARYESDGDLDTSFGTSGTGIVTTDFGSVQDVTRAVVQYPSAAGHKIVAAGYANTSPTSSEYQFRTSPAITPTTDLGYIVRQQRQGADEAWGTPRRSGTSSSKIRNSLRWVGAGPSSKARYCPIR